MIKKDNGQFLLTAFFDSILVGQDTFFDFGKLKTFQTIS